MPSLRVEDGQLIGAGGRFGKGRIVRVGVERHIRPAALQLPQHQLAGNAKKIPGQRTPLRIVPAVVANQGQKHLLNHVFGGGRRTAHVQREPVDGGLAAAVERAKRLFVAATHPQEELVVRLRGCLHHGFVTHDSSGMPESSTILTLSGR